MQELENLTGTGQLIPEPTSVEEISGFLMRAEQQLADARTASLSATSDHEIWRSPVTQVHFVVDSRIKSRYTANAVLRQAGLPKRF